MLEFIVKSSLMSMSHCGNSKGDLAKHVKTMI